MLSEKQKEAIYLEARRTPEYCQIAILDVLLAIHDELWQARMHRESEYSEDAETDPFQTLNGPLTPPYRNPVPERER